MLEYTCFFLLFFLPLVFLPFGASPFEIPKVFIAEVGIEIAVFFYILRNGLSLDGFDKKHLFLTLMLFILSLVHLIFYKTQVSFFGNIFRLQGIFLLWHLLLFSLLSAKTNFQRIPKILYILPSILIFISVFVFPVNPSGRFVATLGEPNALAATSVFFFPFLYFLSTKKKFPKILSLFWVFAIVLLSGSRSGLVALGIQLFFILSLEKLKLPIKRGLFICFSLIFLSLLLPFIEKGGILEKRVEIWETAFYAGFSSAFWGSGFGNVEKILQESSKKLGNNLQFQYVDSSHNIILDFWIQGGVLAVLLLSSLIYHSIKNLLLKNKKLELTAFLGVFTVMLFNPQSVVTLLAVWWIIGYGFS